MSKPDEIVSSAADTTVSMPVNTTTVESKSKEGSYQDAQLLLHAMKAAAVALPPTVSPVASPSPSFSSTSTTDVETELDLAACLVALSRSPSATVSSTSTVSVSSPNLSPPPDPVRSSSPTTKATASSQAQQEPPATRRKSLRKTRACNKTSKRYRGQEEEKPSDPEAPPRKKPKQTSSTATEGSSAWETRFEQLEHYKARFGHANPKSGKASRLPLARWLKDQRQLFRNDILAADQVRRLKALGCTGFDRESTYAAKTSVATSTSSNSTSSTSTTSSNPPKPKPKAVVTKKSPCKKAVPKEETSSPSPSLSATGTLLPPGPPTIQEPNQHDVVFGRGASIYKLPGNVRFRSIVSKRKLEYISKPDHEKMPIARQIVRHVRSLGGRFLAKDKATSGYWHDVGDKLALKKTSMTLRQDARAIREADATTTTKATPNDTTSAGPGKTTTTTMSSETTAVASSTPTGTATAKKRAPPPTTKATNSGGIPDKTVATKKRAPTSTKTKKKKKKKASPSSCSSSTWEDWYTKLVDYQARNGDVNPSQCDTAPASEQKLAQWLEAQRQGFRQGTLPAEETKSLNDLGCRGFGFGEDEDTKPSWDERYQELVAFKEQNGNADPKGDCPLARWVAEQCNALQRKRLPKTKAKMLQDVLLLQGCEGSFLGGTNNNKKEEEEESSSPMEEKEAVTAGKEEEPQQPPQKRASRRQTRSRRMGAGAYRIMLLSG